MKRSLNIKNKSLVKFESFGSPGITPTRNCTHFLKIGFVVAESEKERKKFIFMPIKYMQFRVGAIPRLPNFSFKMCY